MNGNNMDPLACLLVFVAAAFLSPLVFCVWQAFQDRKIYKTIKQARSVQNGIPVEIFQLSNSGWNHRNARTTIPFRCQNENLILTGRGFWSERVAIKLITRGGPGFLWEAILDKKRLGWLESEGEKYWGVLTPECAPSRENEPQSFGGA